MKPNKMFHITFVCINDIIQEIEDDNSIDDLQKIFLIKKAQKLNESQMNWIAGKLGDSYCGGDFWRDLRERFRQIIEKEK